VELYFAPDDIDYWGIDEIGNRVAGIMLKDGYGHYSAGEPESIYRNLKFIRLTAFGTELCDFMRENMARLSLPEPESLDSECKNYEFTNNVVNVRRMLKAKKTKWKM
jgi:hypothetical protein